MHPLARFLQSNEAWLMRRIRDYAVARGYSRYTSTLEEAWRISVAELTRSIVLALDVSEAPWELRPDDDFISDAIAAFGVLEAQRHRARGISLEMFMGLMKYYRQTYLDLLHDAERLHAVENQDRREQLQRDQQTHALFIDRIFDRIEIAYCVEWGRDGSTSQATEELRAANRKITNEKNKFLTIFESLPTAVFLLDEERRIVHMNHAGAQILDPAAKSGEHYYSHANERLRFPWLEEELSRFAKADVENEYECLINLPDGNDCQVLAHFRQMDDISLKYSGTLVILRDITQRKKAEEELRQAQSHLIQQEKMASIGQLAAGVAHEINNPMGFILSNLSTVRGYVDNLLTFVSVQDRALAGADVASMQEVAEARKRLDIDYLSGDANTLIAESIEGVERVSRIVQDLKTFSRIDRADYDTVDLNKVLDTTLNIAWSEIKYVATLDRQYGQLPEFHGHPQQLGQVFLNLFVNAAQAMSSPGTITVATRCDANNIYVTVSDTGSGISSEHLSRIFEPFYTTKDVGEGTGLGLSISYGIVKNHGGNISVESRVGEGSTFTVTLPLHHAVAEK